MGRKKYSISLIRIESVFYAAHAAGSILEIISTSHLDGIVIEIAFVSTVVVGCGGAPQESAFTEISVRATIEATCGEYSKTSAIVFCRGMADSAFLRTTLPAVRGGERLCRTLTGTAIAAVTRLTADEIGQLGPFGIGGQMPAIGADQQRGRPIVEIAEAGHVAKPAVRTIAKWLLITCAVAEGDGISVSSERGAHVFGHPALTANSERTIDISVGIGHRSRAIRLCETQ